MRGVMARGRDSATGVCRVAVSVSGVFFVCGVARKEHGNEC